MRQSLLLMSIILAGLLGFIGYCWLLLDFYQDIKLGRYEQEPLDTAVRIGIIIAYCYVAFRFIQLKLKNSQLPGSTKPTLQSRSWWSKPARASKPTGLGEGSIWGLHSRPHRSS